MVTKICIYCGKEFRIQPSKTEISKCCSKECRDNYKRQGGKRTCERCGKGFYYSPSQEHTAKYCSKECKINVQGRVMLKCQECGKEFIVSHNLKNRKYCSKECRQKPKKQFKRVCAQCGKEYIIHKCREYESKYCSLKCNGLAKKNKETNSRRVIKCDYCGKPFLIYKWHEKRDENHFCSTKCAGNFIRVGDPKENKHFYGSAFWKELRDKCYERDNYTCQVCGTYRQSLQAHHIKPRKMGGEDILENLITLCNSCHGKIGFKFKKALRGKFKIE